MQTVRRMPHRNKCKRFLKPERMAPDLRLDNALGRQVLSKRQSFVLADIPSIEALAIEIAGFDRIGIYKTKVAHADMRKLLRYV